MPEHLSSPPQMQTVPAARHTDIRPVNDPLQQDIYTEGLQNLRIQRKLTVGAADDPLEHEADAMADKIMRMPEDSFIRRKCTHCGEAEEIQREPVKPFIQQANKAGIWLQQAPPLTSQQTYDAAVVLLQSRNTSMYNILRLGSMGRVVQVSSQNFPVTGGPAGSPQTINVIMNLEISQSGVVSGAAAQFADQSGRLQINGTTVVYTLPLRMNVNIPTGANASAQLAELLYHEGIHMLLFIDRDLRPVFNGNLPPSLTMGMQTSFDAYMRFARNSSRYQALWANLDLAITDFFQDPAHPARAQNMPASTSNTAQMIIRRIVEEKFALDLQIAQFPGTRATSDPLSIATAYLDPYLADEGVAVVGTTRTQLLTQFQFLLTDVQTAVAQAAHPSAPAAGAAGSATPPPGSATPPVVSPPPATPRHP